MGLIGGSQGRNWFNLGLPKVNAGDPISVAYLNKISESIERSSIRGGDGYLVKRSNTGFQINIKKDQIVKSGPYPLTVYMEYDKDGNPIIRVSAGTVNRCIPKIGDKYLDEMIPPFLSVTADSVIALKVTREEGKFFPSKDVEVVSVAGHADGTICKDTDNEGYMILASIRMVTPTQTPNTPQQKPWPRITILNKGNFIVNRLKAGQNTAVWWWDSYVY